MIPKYRAFVKSGTKQMYGGVYEEDAMVPVGVLDITGGEVTVWGCGIENCGMCDDYFRIKDIILMQYTGLKDKNGLEVYFNDVVEDEYGHRYEVVFEGDCLRCNGVRKIRGGHKPKNRWFGIDLEIIGNRFENPKLLEEEE